MLAKLARELPQGDYAFEPKWDGFRCLAFRDHEHVALQSRAERPMERYFPEVSAALSALAEPRFVLDGEIVVITDRGSDFDALLKRIHPAAKHVDRLAAATPASYVAFDLLALGDRDLRDEPFVERRRCLEELARRCGHALAVNAVTWDRADAAVWLEQLAPGTDGVVAKARDLPYRSGKRVMIKVKRIRTAECVVGGFRLAAADEPEVSSLLLGLYDGDVLRHIGVASGFTRDRRRELVEELVPHVTPLEAHPWRHGFALEGGSMGRLPGSAGRWTPDLALDWVALHPVLVCEATYDQVDGCRWRHPGRFVPCRTDRDPRASSIDQLEGCP